MDAVIERFVDFISNTGKTAVATVGSACSGFIIDIIGCNTNQQDYVYYLEIGLKFGAWSISILLGVLGTITWIQKQKDRFNERHNKKNKK